MTINSKGLRNPEVSYLKPDRVVRILILGDSFAMGWGVSQDWTFGARLEEKLNANRGRTQYQVVNAGVEGWGTAQELLFYQTEAYKYTPDIVLLLFYPENDVWNNSYALDDFFRSRRPFYTLHNGELKLIPPGSISTDLDVIANNSDTYGVEDSQGKPSSVKNTLDYVLLQEAKRFLAEHSSLYRVMGTMLLNSPIAAPLRRAGFMAPIHAVERSDVAVYGPDTPATQEAWRITGAILSRLHDEVLARRAEFTILVIGSSYEVHPNLWNEFLKAYPVLPSFEYDLEKPNHQLSEMLSELGIPFLDLLPVFRDRTHESGQRLFLREGHWDRQGVDLAAESAYEWLTSQGFLDESS